MRNATRDKWLHCWSQSIASFCYIYFLVLLLLQCVSHSWGQSFVSCGTQRLWLSSLGQFEAQRKGRVRCCMSWLSIGREQPIILYYCCSHLFVKLPSYSRFYNVELKYLITCVLADGSSLLTVSCRRSGHVSRQVFVIGSTSHYSEIILVCSLFIRSLCLLLLFFGQDFLSQSHPIKFRKDVSYAERTMLTGIEFLQP